MNYQQVQLRSEARDKLLRAATELADARPSGRATGGAGLPARPDVQAALANRLRWCRRSALPSRRRTFHAIRKLCRGARLHHHRPVVACLQVIVLTAALMTFAMARAGTAERAPAVEGRNAMHEIFRKRHAVRSFQSRDISRKDLEAILAAADSAPSAGGLKSREVLVVSDDETKHKLVQAAYGQEFVGQASVVLVFWSVPSRSAAKYGARGRDLFALQDATIAASFAWLQAVASGLGACWVGAFNDDAIRSIFQNKIERDWRPIALLPIGYAAE